MPSRCKIADLRADATDIVFHFLVTRYCNIIPILIEIKIILN